MKLDWSIEPEDIHAIQMLIEQQQKHPFLLQRIARNVDGAPPEITENSLWWTHMMCLLTTQQRSGPDSAVSRFLCIDPFPFSLAVCRQTEDLQSFVEATLTDHGGIRRTSKIARATASNLAKLDDGGWAELRAIADRLLMQRTQKPDPSHYRAEREAAQHLDRHYKEFGPKQSRNFWQSLGLARYEFVIDSRILRWLRHNLDIPFPLSSTCLSDSDYYYFVSDILRDLCGAAGVIPCVFDAAAFASYDAPNAAGLN